MNQGRLTTLASYLRTVPVLKFDLGIWKCGAVACAIGHAAGIPEFKKAGFRIRKSSAGTAPEFEGLYAWGAVGEFFDLDEYECYELFAASEYDPGATPRVVADRIEEFVRDAE